MTTPSSSTGCAAALPSVVGAAARRSAAPHLDRPGVADAERAADGFDGQEDVTQVRVTHKVWWERPLPVPLPLPPSCPLHRPSGAHGSHGGAHLSRSTHRLRSLAACR